MSLDKSIEHGKEHRKEQTKPCKRSCNWCAENRQYAKTKTRQKADQHIKDQKDQTNA